MNERDDLGPVDGAPQWTTAAGKVLNERDLATYATGGIEPADAVRWADAGLMPYQASNYAKAGCDLDLASRLVAASYDSRLYRWAIEHGRSREELLELADTGMGRLVAMAWLVLDVPVSTMAAWWSEGLLPADAIDAGELVTPSPPPGVTSGGTRLIALSDGPDRTWRTDGRPLAPVVEELLGDLRLHDVLAAFGFQVVAESSLTIAPGVDERQLIMDVFDAELGEALTYYFTSSERGTRVDRRTIDDDPWTEHAPAATVGLYDGLATAIDEFCALFPDVELLTVTWDGASDAELLRLVQRFALSDAWDCTVNGRGLSTLDAGDAQWVIPDDLSLWPSSERLISFDAGWVSEELWWCAGLGLLQTRLEVGMPEPVVARTPLGFFDTKNDAVGAVAGVLIGGEHATYTDLERVILFGPGAQDGELRYAQADLVDDVLGSFDPDDEEQQVEPNDRQDPWIWLPAELADGFAEEESNMAGDTWFTFAAADFGAFRAMAGRLGFVMRADVEGQIEQLPYSS